MFENPNKRVEFVRMPEALGLAETILSEHQIKMDDFVDLYGPENIATDKRELRERERNFSDGRIPHLHEDVNVKLAKIFEAIIFDQGVKGKWFGENASLISTSRYDDVVNGVDLIVEWVERQGISRMGASIDVTFNHNIRKKIEYIKDSIESGDLGTIKYFKSKTSNTRGEITGLPRIIVGADVDTVRELTNEWVAKNLTRLTAHPVQFQFFDEAMAQCRYFAQFAEKQGQIRIAAAYEDLLRVLQYQYERKVMALGEDRKIRDGFFRDIQDYFKF